MSDLRPTTFIIASGGGYLCPVCGWAGTFIGNHFADDEGGCIATGICACCAYEPGFDDNPLASDKAKPTIAESITSYRRAWIDMGSPWRGIDATPVPDNWSAEAQLSKLFKRAPFLAE
jgi:hypothetical protein